VTVPSLSALALGHELGHADVSSLLSGLLSGIRAGKYDNAEEWRCMRNVEHAVASELGEPIRPDHQNGHFYWVRIPTTR
jgi:hypothetical protein